MPYIDVEPTWEACARIYTLLVEHGQDQNATEEGRQGLLEMGRKLDAVRQAQKAQEKAGEDKAERFIDYEYGDYLLIDENNRIQAVSGNSDFWDAEQTRVSLGEVEDEYTIVKVIRVHKEIELQG